MTYFQKNLKYILSLFLFAFFLNPVLFSDTTAAQAYTRTQLPQFSDLVERLLPAVVNISTRRTSQNNDSDMIPQLPPGSPFRDFFRRFFQPRVPYTKVSLGSGFIIDKEKGYVITNYHVIRNATQVAITLYNDETYQAEIVGFDEKTDIAVLQLLMENIKEYKALNEVSFGDSDQIRVGDWTLAIGNPFGLGGTVTAGIVSARARALDTSGPYIDFIQTDASINQGNSGGPLFNLNGEVIGINTAIFSPSGGSIGLGFAIPSNPAEKIAQQLIEYGETKRGWLGIYIQQVTEDIAEQFGLDEVMGVFVSDVNPAGPAVNAGIQADDIILRFNNTEVKSMRQLPRLVADTPIGEQVEILVWRNNREITFIVTIGDSSKTQ